MQNEWDRATQTSLHDSISHTGSRFIAKRTCRIANASYPSLQCLSAASQAFHQQIMAEAAVLSALPQLFSGLTYLISRLEKVVTDRAERKRVRRMEQVRQAQFVSQFALAGGPAHEDEEARTIRQYCRRLCELIQTHGHFLWKVKGEEGDGPLGPYSMHSAHALIATQLAILGLRPGIPQHTPAPPPYAAPSIPISGWFSPIFSNRRNDSRYLSTRV